MTADIRNSDLLPGTEPGEAGLVAETQPNRESICRDLGRPAYGNQDNKIDW
jgi:hypothetical protein